MPRLICEGRYTHAPSRCSTSNTKAEQLESNQKKVVCGSVKDHMTAGGFDVHIHVYRDRLQRLVMHLYHFITVKVRKVPTRQMQSPNTPDKHD